MKNRVIVCACLVCASSLWSGESRDAAWQTRLATGREALRIAEALIAKLELEDAGRDEAWIALAEAWGAYDPGRGLEKFANVRDSSKLEAAAIQLCAQHAKKLAEEHGIPKALETISAIPYGSLRHLGWAALGEVWAQSDRVRAATWARSLPRETDRQWTLYFVARGTARASHAEALKLVEECNDPFFTECLGRDLALQRARLHPAGAWTASSDCPDHLQWQVAEEIGFRWANKDRDAARKAIEASSFPDTRTAGLCGIAAAQALQTPRSASEALTAADPEGRFRTSATRLVRAWAKKHPAEALEWARERRLGAEALRVWASHDPPAALKALGSVDDRELWNAYADGFARQDARAALAWAKTLTDTVARCHALIHVARGAVYRDED